jgi:hypothetical protein
MTEKDVLCLFLKPSRMKGFSLFVFAERACSAIIRVWAQ